MCSATVPVKTTHRHLARNESQSVLAASPKNSSASRRSRGDEKRRRSRRGACQNRGGVAGTVVKDFKPRDDTAEEGLIRSDFDHGGNFDARAATHDFRVVEFDKVGVAITQV